MSTERKKILIVLGMHRSGTSAITRGLEVLGVDLGNSLMPAATDNNDKGFFEDVDFHALNSRLLAHLGSDWDKLSAIQPGNLLLPECQALQDDAERILASKLADTRCFAIKDPQASLLLPFWQHIFSRLDVDARYLICFRHPLSVAASLWKRDGIYPAKSQLLWAKYSLAALQGALTQQPLVVDYDALMETPHLQLARIATAFDLPGPDAAPEAFAVFSQEFLSPVLRHSQFSEAQLSNQREVLRPIQELHDLLKAAANADAGASLAGWRDQCQHLLNTFAALEPVAREIDTLNSLELPEKLIRERDSLLSHSAKLQDECHEAWARHAAAWAQHDAVLAQHAAVLARLNQIRNNPLYRVLRALKHYRAIPGVIGTKLSEATRLLWQCMPLSTNQKLHCKVWLFQRAGRLFRHTQAYQNWLRSTDQVIACPAANAGPIDWINEPIQQVKRLRSQAPAEQPAKLITFYLPQFHAIPENDEWWGEGFTEWTNVKPAQPQYRGHYQPHIPGELGYYNLEDPEIQRRQVELAKLYGIAGFCFYFYWFGGKRLLEKPIENYLQNRDLDLPFCLCWANENWSRRWDGLDDQILIGQKHSADDDLAFVAHVAAYLRDERYIRIDGKPLLLVYRPGELPDAKATATRWRTWCRENGVGEIYLAYTQSFDKAHPARYGFDAAVEFPPNGSAPDDVTDSVLPMQDNFRGKVYDWRTYLKRSAKPDQPKYPLFRGVCPSWDNTARRKERGTSFINSSPRGYQEWLFNAIRDTVRRFPQEDRRLVFINAWNEWAEGAHLEPDQRYGYGYLEATRMASLRANLQQTSPPRTTQLKLAVLIHAYYPEVFQEILGYLEQIEGIKLKLYVSCPPEGSRLISNLLEYSSHAYQLEELSNRGRDVLPFLKLLPRAIDEGFEYVLKVHTKKSVHRTDGDVWRRDLYDKLLTGQAMRNALETFANFPSTGILGPDGHLVPMSFYWGSNAHAVEKLACRLGIRPSDLSGLNFVAGTMFFAQVRALQPLLGLALDDDDFEVESRQVDGTLAHALERALSISALAAGLSVRSGTAVAGERDYAFAEAAS